MKHSQMSRSGLQLGAACAALALGAGIAVAEPHATPSDTRVRVQDWTLVPVLIADNDTVVVHSVLALRDKTDVTGQNIVSVWYHAPQDGGSHWEADAWETQDQGEAVKKIKDELNIPDSLDWLWPTTDPVSGNLQQLTPEGYDKGLFTYDPLTIELEGNPDRDLIVEILTAYGYKSADLVFEKDGFPCGADTFLGTLKATTEDAAKTSSWDIDSQSTAFAAAMTGCIAAVITLPPPSTFPPPATIPGTTIPWPSWCDALQSTPYWSPGAVTRDPGADGPTTCCYKQEVEVLMLCHRGALWWAFDQVMKYSYQDPFCCPNPGINACPASPNCAVPPIPTAPPAATPPTGPHPYYPGEGWF